MPENGGPWHSSDSVQWLVCIPTPPARNPNQNTSSQMPARRELRQVYYLFLTPSLRLAWPLERLLSAATRCIRLIPARSSCHQAPHTQERNLGPCRSLARSIRSLS